MRLELDVQYASQQTGLPGEDAFAAWVTAALGEWRGPSLAVTVRIVDEAESAELNQRYRGKVGATNVLSFPFETPPGADSDILGDIVICAPVVRREAEVQGKPENAHWAHMVAHGILHLRGYDHIEVADAEHMEGEETRILADLGFADPYA